MSCLKHKKITKWNSLSEQGIAYRKLRSIEPENVFGQIKIKDLEDFI